MLARNVSSPERGMLSGVAESLEGDDDAGDDGQRLSAFVGNAVGHGAYAWHCDADPSLLSWDSPWAQQHGIYYNREVRLLAPVSAPFS